MNKIKRYGMPYQGSKNSIAAWIVGILPAADTFCDLFFGGGAVTHAAMLSGKWEHFIANDINDKLPKLFIECIQGKHTTQTHTEWISKEEFKAKKDENAYIALCWSFGNNQKDYLYGKDKEYQKKCLHNAVFFNDLSGLESLGINITKIDENSVYDRYISYKKQIKEQLKVKHFDLQSLENLVRLSSLERLQNFESLQRLDNNGNLLQISGIDYQDVSIPKNSIIYCDIPYKSTRCDAYKGFNHDRFYEWAERQENIFISEYNMPKEFVCFAEKEKTVLSTNKGTSGKAQEKIFTNKQTLEKYKLELQGLI